MLTKRRITFEVSEEQYQKLKDHLTYGLMKRVFNAMVDDVVTMLEEYGDIFVVTILTKRISYRSAVEDNQPKEH